MSEEKKYDANKPFQEHSLDKCANLISSSLYKMQLGVNSLKDEIKSLVDVQTAILEELQKQNKKE